MNKRIFNKHRHKKYFDKNSGFSEPKPCSLLYIEMLNKITEELTAISYTDNPDMFPVFMIDNPDSNTKVLRFMDYEIGYVSVDENDIIEEVKIYDHRTNSFPKGDYKEVCEKYIGYKLCKPRKHNK